jgi:hypothetical protein
MAQYQIRAFIESCLQAHRDFDLQLNEYQVRFLLSSRSEEDTGFEAEVSCEAESWKAAVTLAIDEIIPPILDVVSFHRHTPMLLGTPTRVLKAEPEASRRRAILINTKRDPNTYLISGTNVAEINELLSRDFRFPGPVLRWLRNAYRPLPIRDRFVFAWLALENLAGLKTIAKTCPSCGVALPSYGSGDRDAAYALIQASDPNVSEQEFKVWWNELRNSVFHGGREPHAGFLAQLRAASDVILKAVNERVARTLGLDPESRPRIPIGEEQVYYRHHFIEFDCAQRESEFASPVPDVQELEEIIDRMGDISVLAGAELIGWPETDLW